LVQEKSCDNKEEMFAARPVEDSSTVTLMYRRFPAHKIAAGQFADPGITLFNPAKPIPSAHHASSGLPNSLFLYHAMGQ